MTSPFHIWALASLSELCRTSQTLANARQVSKLTIKCFYFSFHAFCFKPVWTIIRNSSTPSEGVAHKISHVLLVKEETLRMPESASLNISFYLIPTVKFSKLSLRSSSTPPPINKVDSFIAKLLSCFLSSQVSDGFIPRVSNSIALENHALNSPR